MDDRMGPPMGWFAPRGDEIPVPNLLHGLPQSGQQPEPEPQPVAMPDVYARAQQGQRVWQHEQQQIAPYLDATRALDRRLAALRRETVRTQVWHALRWAAAGVVAGGLGVLVWRMLVIDTPRSTRLRAGHRDADETRGAAR